MRRELIRQQLKETPEKSDRQIADGLEVDHKTVGAQRKEMESTGEIPRLDTRVGADGREQRKPATEPDPPRRPVSIYNPTRREAKAIQNPAMVERMASMAGLSAILRSMTSKGISPLLAVSSLRRAQFCAGYGLPKSEENTVLRLVFIWCLSI